MTHLTTRHFVTVLAVVCSSICQIQCGRPSGDVPRLVPASLDEIQQQTRSDARAACENDSLAAHLALIEQDPVETLRRARRQWSGVNSYRMTLHTQERNDGVLGCERVIEATIVEAPRIISLRWRENPAKIDRLLYRPGHHDDQLVVHPTGVLGRIVRSVRVDPHGEQARSNSRNDITQLGLANTLRTLVEDFEQAAEGGGQVRCMGIQPDGPDGRPAVVMTRVQENNPESRTLVVYLNADDLRPVRVQQFGQADQLLASYSFLNYQPVQAEEDEFTLAALGLE